MPLQTDWTRGEDFLKKTDKVFAQLIEKYGSCTLKPVLPNRYFPTLVKGIVAQQVANDVSQNIFAAFTRIYGPEPKPEELIAAKNEDMEECGLSLQKIQYIKDLSQSVIDKKINLNKFEEMDDNAIIKQLTNVRGLGRWTAEVFLILALGRADVLPADDFGLKKAIKELFALEQMPQKRSQITSIAEPWRPWRSLATWYLWQGFADIE